MAFEGGLLLLPPPATKPPQVSSRTAAGLPAKPEAVGSCYRAANGERGAVRLRSKINQAHNLPSVGREQRATAIPGQRRSAQVGDASR